MFIELMENVMQFRSIPPHLQGSLDKEPGNGSITFLRFDVQYTCLASAAEFI